MNPAPSKIANSHWQIAISKERGGIICLIIFILLVASVFPEPVEFSGSGGIMTDQGWTIYDSTQQTSSEFRFNFNPTLSIYDVPLSVDILLSTDENMVKQALNKYKVKIEPKNVIGTLVNNPDFGLTIPEASVGSFNPNYSNLILANTPVNGFTVEVKPWVTHFAFTAGHTQRPVESSDTSYPAYSRMLYAGTFGFGDKRSSYFDFTFLHSMDDPTSIARNYMVIEPYDSTVPPETIELVKPQENYILGAKLNLQLFNDIFKLASEVTGSEFTRDSRVPILREKKVPDWVENTFRPRMSSQADFSYKVRPEINVWNTRFSGTVKMIGPGYQSMGLQFLRNDIFGYDIAIDRTFFNNQISASGSFAKEKDNLLDLKRLTTNFTTYSINLSANFSNLPSLQITYTPSVQKDQASEDRMLNMSINSYYSFNTGALSQSPGISFYYQSRQSVPFAEKSATTQISLSHSIDFNSPLSLSVNASFDNTIAGAITSKSTTIDLSPSYTLFGSWRNNLSLNGVLESASKRFDIRYNSSFPIRKIADGNFNLTRSYYSSSEDEDYNCWSLSASLSKNW